jgi:hypothetical protein
MATTPSRCDSARSLYSDRANTSPIRDRSSKVEVQVELVRAQSPVDYRNRGNSSGGSLVRCGAGGVARDGHRSLAELAGRQVGQSTMPGGAGHDSGCSFRSASRQAMKSGASRQMMSSTPLRSDSTSSLNSARSVASPMRRSHDTIMGPALVRARAGHNSQRLQTGGHHNLAHRAVTQSQSPPRAIATALVQTPRAPPLTARPPPQANSFPYSSRSNPRGESTIGCAAAHRTVGPLYLA